MYKNLWRNIDNLKRKINIQLFREFKEFEILLRWPLDYQCLIIDEVLIKYEYKM